MYSELSSVSIWHSHPTLRWVCISLTFFSSTVAFYLLFSLVFGKAGQLHQFVRGLHRVRVIMSENNTSFPEPIVGSPHPEFISGTPFYTIFVFSKSQQRALNSSDPILSQIWPTELQRFPALSRIIAAFALKGPTISIHFFLAQLRAIASHHLSHFMRVDELPEGDDMVQAHTFVFDQRCLISTTGETSNGSDGEVETAPPTGESPFVIPIDFPAPLPQSGLPRPVLTRTSS